MIILGIDPGLRITGWGLIKSEGHQLKFIASGLIKADATETLGVRLAFIFEELTQIIERYNPVAAAVEETFVNKNPASALKLGQARGVALAAPAMQGLPVAEYAANKIKKSLVGAGHASKEQITMMVQTLLPASRQKNGGRMGADEADALAVAICHAHHGVTHMKLQDAVLRSSAQ